MAAGQVYNHGFGGAGRAPFGSIFSGEEFPDRLADLTAASQEKGGSRGRVRQALAKLVLGGTAEAAPQQNALGEQTAALPADALHDVNGPAELSTPVLESPPEHELPPVPRV